MESLFFFFHHVANNTAAKKSTIDGTCASIALDSATFTPARVKM
jgi:hypothetical protein